MSLLLKRGPHYVVAVQTEKLCYLAYNDTSKMYYLTEFRAIAEGFKNTIDALDAYSDLCGRLQVKKDIYSRYLIIGMNKV